MPHILTADLGNSALKLRLFRLAGEARAVSGELVRGADLERSAASAGLASLAAAWLAEGPAPERVAVSSVAGEEDAAALVEAIATAPAADRPARVEVLLAPDAGLENRCRVPARVGRDRLYAARAALALVGRPAVVIDCGTALTVDAVAPLDAGPGAAADASSHGAGGGAFLGGAIAPGPALLARALGEGAAQLFAVAPDASAPALGRDTREALAAGVVHGLRGAAARLAREVAREAGFGAHALVVTGGGAGLLLGPAERGDAELADALVVPDLVHHGLLLALGITPPGVRGALGARAAAGAGREPR
jgi:type III pantothenate kinase